MKSMRLWALLCAVWLMAATTAQADSPNPAFEAAKQAAKAGPQDIPLAGQATLHLPAKHQFVPQPQAGALLVAMGNPGTHEDLLGLVFPTGDQAQWFATLRFEKSGYIKDDDAKDWNAEDLLKSYRDGTEANNAEREKLGVPALEIVGWAEKPAYEAATHRLVWAMSSREKGAPANQPQGVNYNTYALGREGYISLNLITALNDLPADKPAAATLLGALEFDEGKRYSDFNASTDHIAEYGLAALVLGVGAKKLGLLAVALAFLAKFAKVGLLAVLGFGGLFAKFSKFFKRKAKPEQPL